MHRERPTRRPGRKAGADHIGKLREGSEKLTGLSRKFSEAVDDLVGATVRLHRNHRRLERLERDLREGGSRLLAAARRSQDH